MTSPDHRRASLEAAQNDPSRPAGVSAALDLLRTLVPALLFLPAVLAPPVNHDVAAILAFAQRWLAGERLYTGLIDVNPPLIYVLNLLPAWLASVTPLDAVSALRLCVLGFGVCCWLLCLRVRERSTEGAVERAFLDALPILFLLAGGYDFAQREHLMAVGALPYVMSASQRAQGRRSPQRFAVAIVAAGAFALKPHFLGIPLLVELGVLYARMAAGGAGWHGLAVAARQTLRDPVPWAMAGVWLIYLASIPLFFADYVGVVLPLVWQQYVGLGGLTPWQFLLVPRMTSAMMVLLPALGVSLRLAAAGARVSGAPLPRMLALAALGAAVSAMAQHKGWSYHIVPLELFACALAALLAARWLDAGAGAGRGATGRSAVVLVGACVLYAAANGEAPWNQLGYIGSEEQRLAELIEHHAGGQRILVLSPGIAPIYPALNYAGAVNPLRTMNMWLLQGVNQTCLANGRRYREPAEMGDAERFFYEAVAEDFARAPPPVVLVDMEPGIPICGEEFDFIAYFRRHPLFARTWSHYQLAMEWKRYRFYTRKD